MGATVAMAVAFSHAPCALRHGGLSAPLFDLQVFEVVAARLAGLARCSAPGANALEPRYPT